MPIVFPGGGCVPTSVGDIASEVIVKLENRTTDLQRAYQWLVESLVELTSSSELRGEFDQLEASGPLFNLVPGQKEYAFSNLVNFFDYNDGSLNMRIWTDPPTNSTPLRMNFTTYQFADMYPNNRGRPSAWYRFNDLIGFDMVPDVPYQVQMRYQRQYPIACPLQNTQLLLPLDWYDVIVLLAVYRGFIELNEYEKASATHTILFGDPKQPAYVGLIEKRKKRYQREAWRQEVTLRPWVGTYVQRTR